MKIVKNQLNLKQVNNLKLQQEEAKKEGAHVEEQKQPEKKVDLKKAENLKEGTSRLESFLKQEEVQAAPRRIIIKDKKEEGTPLNPLRSTLGGIRGKLNRASDDSEGLAISEKMKKAIEEAKEKKENAKAEWLKDNPNGTDEEFEKYWAEKQSSESAIRDADMAAEMVNYTKNNILAQAGKAMLEEQAAKEAEDTGKAGDVKDKCEYDADGKLIKKTVYKEDGTIDYIEEYQYNKEGKLAKSVVKDADGNIKKLINYEYNTRGYAVCETVEEPHQGGGWLATQFNGYDEQGRLVYQQNYPNAYSTSYEYWGNTDTLKFEKKYYDTLQAYTEIKEYDESGRIIKENFYSYACDKSRQEGKDTCTIYEYNNETDENYSTACIYDSKGALINKEEYEDGVLTRRYSYTDGKLFFYTEYENGQESRLTSYFYDSNGVLTGAKVHEYVTLPKGRCGLFKEQIFYYPDGSVKSHYTATEHDENGKTMSSNTVYYDPDGNITNVKVQDSECTKEYDSNGLLVSKKMSDGQTEYKYTYNENGIRTEQCFINGVLRSEKTCKLNDIGELDNSIPEQDYVNAVTARETSLEENSTPIHTTKYNKSGELTEEIHYNKNGEVETVVKYDTQYTRKGTKYVVEDCYDNNGNLTARKIYNDDGTVQSYTSYNTDGNKIKTDIYENNEVVTTYEYAYYDGTNTIKTEVKTDASTGVVVDKKEYNGDGRVITDITYNNNGVQTGKTEYNYANDSYNRSQIIQTANVYNSAGELTTVVITKMRTEGSEVGGREITEYNTQGNVVHKISEQPREKVETWYENGVVIKSVKTTYENAALTRDTVSHGKLKNTVETYYEDGKAVRVVTKYPDGTTETVEL